MPAPAAEQTAGHHRGWGDDAGRRDDARQDRGVAGRPRPAGEGGALRADDGWLQPGDGSGDDRLGRRRLRGARAAGRPPARPGHLELGPRRRVGAAARPDRARQPPGACGPVVRGRRAVVRHQGAVPRPPPVHHAPGPARGGRRPGCRDHRPVPAHGRRRPRSAPRRSPACPARATGTPTSTPSWPPGGRSPTSTWRRCRSSATSWPGWTPTVRRRLRSGSCTATSRRPTCW